MHDLKNITYFFVVIFVVIDMSVKTIFIALDTDLDLDGVLKVAGDIKSLYKKASDAFASHASNIPQFAIKLGLEFFCRPGF